MRLIFSTTRTLHQKPFSDAKLFSRLSALQSTFVTKPSTNLKAVTKNKLKLYIITIILYPPLYFLFNKF